MSVPGGGDSGVETECEVESNDSSMSNLSVSDNSNMAAPIARSLPVAVAPLPPVSAPLSPPMASSSSSHQHQEDGYLGDCSSDGGNEKNFPLPPDWSSYSSRISLPPSPLQSDTPSSPQNSADDIEPPAGLQFSTVSVVSDQSGGGSSLGYHILHHQDWAPGNQSSLRTKIRHGRTATGFRSKFNAQSVQDDWSKVKRTIAERKMRSAANTNNSEQVEQLCLAGCVDVNSCDEHQRSALHFAAAKGYSDVVEVLLRNGADPNQTDRLGNTPLHLAACTNHVPVVTLLLRAGTAVTTLDNNGRTPLQLAKSKLKLLQRNSIQSDGMSRVKAEVNSILEMMTEYLKRVSEDTCNYEHLIQSFSQRLHVHTSHSQLTNDLGSLLNDLSSMNLQN